MLDNLTNEEGKKFHDLIRQCSSKPLVGEPPKPWWIRLFNWFKRKVK